MQPVRSFENKFLVYTMYEIAMKINSKVNFFVLAMQISLKVISCVPVLAWAHLIAAKCPLHVDISLSECNTG